jgi:carbon starvation protein
MEVLMLVLVCGAGYLAAYHTYGKFLAKKIFDLRPDSPVPSRVLNDGIDYVPARKGIIFGHHFTSIAGTGPIVGPAIGIIWGWVPAVLWVVFGSIFMGAAHDLGSLVVSLRNEGRSLSEIAAKYVNARVRLIFFSIVFLVLLIVTAIFGVVIAIVFNVFPSAVLPVWLQIPIAVGLGYAVYTRRLPVAPSTAAAVACMYACIAIGAILERTRPGAMSIGAIGSMPGTGVWVIILLVYTWFASTLPVTTLLQPRDYINAWQLFIAMGLLAAGTAAAAISGGLHLVAPAVNTNLPPGTPPLWPFMFVTIACGAISGFHCLVASGTSPKQIRAEPDCRFVGYGSMLLEGMLAILVLVCVGAAIGMGGGLLSGKQAWASQYGYWIGGGGLADKIKPVVNGAANLACSLGLPRAAGTTLMGVFIASFAGTTLDTAVRLQRYVIGELAGDARVPLLANRWAATTVAVLAAAGLAFATGPDGQGAMLLWPLFGTANQLLAALALLVVSIYLKRRGGFKFLTTAIPCLVMLAIAGWAMVRNEAAFIESGRRLLAVIGGCILALAAWMTLETAIVFFKAGRPTGRQRTV